MNTENLTRRGAMHTLTCCAGLPAIAALSASAALAETGHAPAHSAAPAHGAEAAPAHGAEAAPAHGAEAAPAHAAEAAPAPAPAQPAQPGMMPDAALNLLKTGNAEFITDAPYRGAKNRQRRLEIALGQHPFAVLVGCSDSRVTPELLFGRGLGELFIIRVAGNTVDLTALGSIEYAIANLGVPLIVVLGHERCGAVHAAVEVVEHNATYPGRIGDMIEPIIPAVLKVRGQPGDLLTNAVRANVERVVMGLLQSSVLLQDMVAEGRLRIVGAQYDLEDGVVEFFDA